MGGMIGVVSHGVGTVLGFVLIGTAKYGIRNHDGSFSRDRAKEPARSVKPFEIKLSEGAKAGKGGVLPGAKVTGEISRIRGIPAGQDSISPIAITTSPTSINCSTR